MCIKHYNRLRRKGTTDDKRKNAAKPCTIEGCDRPRAAFGRCDRHYRQEHRPRNPVRHEGRVCVNCSGPVPPERNARAIFCSVRCKNLERARTGAAREATRRHYFKQLYGLTVEQVEEMAAKGCEICGTSEWTGKHARPHVDHCHKTGRVRGILCGECNTGLGKFRDDPALLRRAVEYLSRA